MTDTNLQVQYVRFSGSWMIKWLEFAELSKSSDYEIAKTFITSSNNVILCWKAALFMSSDDSPGIGLGLYYLSGPIEKFNNMQYAISIMKPDFSIVEKRTSSSYEANRSSGRGWGEYFVDKDPVAVRAKYGLKESDPLLIRITMKIPFSAFSFAPSASLVKPETCTSATQTEVETLSNTDRAQNEAEKEELRKKLEEERGATAKLLTWACKTPITPDMAFETVKLLILQAKNQEGTKSAVSGKPKV